MGVLCALNYHYYCLHWSRDIGTFVFRSDEWIFRIVQSTATNFGLASSFHRIRKCSGGQGLFAEPFGSQPSVVFDQGSESFLYFPHFLSIPDRLMSSPVGYDDAVYSGDADDDYIMGDNGSGEGKLNYICFNFYDLYIILY